MVENKSFDEEKRLAALHSYNLLDTPAEEAFDCITRVAHNTLAAPIALLTLIDRDRQWFKSHQGTDIQETPRDLAFCNRTILGSEAVIIPNLKSDSVFQKNPLVTGAPHLRFYWGFPLRTKDGYNIGSLCVLGYKPRRAEKGEVATLIDLAKLAIDQIELRNIVDTDYVTGLLTQRAFVKIGAQHFIEAAKDRAALSVVVFEIDGFKDIDAHYGHGVGDDLLQLVMNKTKALLENGMILGRMGGGRFAILMPRTALEAAETLAEKITESIDQTRMEMDKGIICPVVHAGVSARNEGDNNFLFLFARTEINMHGAKREALQKFDKPRTTTLDSSGAIIGRSSPRTK